ncbi:peptidylprolyl isomerase [Pseudoblastomonas halimionae]|uniref:Peptidylprolyl isomerase n=1 Tax=Alteriqipengyuania halimionae TaxID=1926630 RepID=A0A6I4TYA2_9SPHN|nr:peptidylprolyl isomerase [Alteriqipengyuania halimionae]MXP08630.1 peptidylprolyl isomerase [Alteriqipengyuania halimionae]
MTKHLLAAAALIALASPSFAQDEEQTAPSPNEIIAAAPSSAWIAIDPEDLVVMRLAPDRDGNDRTVVMQLMPAPFSQGWIENIRTLARAKYWDGSMVLRVQDNYVVQWGQPDPEMGVEPKPVPAGLNVVPESDFVATGLLSIPDPRGRPRFNYTLGAIMMRLAMTAADGGIQLPEEFADYDPDEDELPKLPGPQIGDQYASFASIWNGWPIAGALGGEENSFWPIHCYGMVGVGRNMSPDTGDGSQLYTVIGHAPRHLDRNIALVGRIISGIEHLSSLPRGKGPLGFYEDAEKRVPIEWVRVASDLPEGERPAFEYFDTATEDFARYADARANRRDPFFNVPAGGADVCNIPVPVRAVAGD